MTRKALPSLELRCLGPPTVLVGDACPAPDVLWRKHVALLAYLALSPGLTRSREHLLGLLWPEKSQERARHSLNEAVRRLRAGLGLARVLSEGERIRLNEADLVVDALRVERLAIHDLPEAIRLLHGEFLEGLVLDDAPAYEEWVLEKRRQFSAKLVAILLRSGEDALVRNAYHEALTAAQQVLVLEPYAEQAVSLLLRASALAGDATGALASFKTFRERLHRDLGEEPSRELLSLAECIRSQRWRRASPAYAELEPPLVGRSDVHQVAFRLLESGIGGGTRCLLIMGNPGMGRTRLLNECAERLALAGAAVVAARPLENDHDAPWSTLRVLLSAGLGTIPGVAAAAPQALAVLAALSPELAGRIQSIQPRDRADVAVALKSLLQAVSEEQPLGILIDDAHLADGSSIGALVAATGALEDARVVLVLTVDITAESLPRELMSLQAEIGRRISGESVVLKPFTHEDMRALVSALAMWCESDEMVDRLARRLVHEAGGMPFFAVTLLRDLDRTSTLKDDLLIWPRPAATLESPLPFSVPDLARLAVVGRVANLDEEAGNVLRAASIGGGRALDVQLIAQLVDMSVERVERVLDRLERMHFVRYDGIRYAFAAQMMAAVVRGECLTPGQRMRLRQRALVALGSREDLESRVLRVEILSKVDRGSETYHEALEVARTAMAGGSVRSARRALLAAENVAWDAPSLEAIEEIRGRLDV